MSTSAYASDWMDGSLAGEGSVRYEQSWVDTNIIICNSALMNIDGLGQREICVQENSEYVVGQIDGRTFLQGPEDEEMHLVYWQSPGSGSLTSNINMGVSYSTGHTVATIVQLTDKWPYVVNNLTDRLSTYHPSQEELPSIGDVTMSDVSYAYKVTSGADYTPEHVGTSVYRGAFSKNGKYYVGRVNDGGSSYLMRVNTQAHTFRIIHTLNSGPAEFAISDDGNFIAGIGSGAGYYIYKFDGTCGSVHVNTMSSLLECPRRSYADAMPSGTAVNETFYDDEAAIYFNSSDSIILRSNLLRDPSLPPIFMLHDSALVQIKLSQRFDYLALGDSYSSGEGDFVLSNTNKSRYLLGTDVTGDYANGVPEEKCHISSRSYPFLLRQSMGLTGNAMKSVACSGATSIDVQGWSELDFDDYGYAGQRYTKSTGEKKPRLSELQSAYRIALQNDALEQFTPGRIQQIDFVRHYRPKVITLTIGGNDTGFAETLEACVVSSMCHDATDQGRKDIGALIHGEFTRLRDVFAALKDASPQTKIYVIGYPQFVSSGVASICGYNVSLNNDERHMITESVTYMNHVIEAAASEAGAYYVDVEDVLGEHILCGLDPTKYVNGVGDILLGDSREELFHPNAKGHQAIADRIKNGLDGRTLLTFDDCESNTIITCPGQAPTGLLAVPEYLNPPIGTGERIVRAVGLVQSQAQNAGSFIVGALEKGAEYTVKLNPTAAQPTTLYRAWLYSDPVDLGEFTTGSDGSLEATITIPSTVPAGYHTLEIEGATYSGEPVMYKQIILVTGTDPADLDEDGIPDVQQPCGAFLISSGVDTDLDGIDDACDPEISDTPQLYRVREGDTTRTYNGSPEHADYLYIERNTRTSSTTGITDDYDPDGDGWSIVGVSQGTPFTTSSAPDTAPAANFEVIGAGTNSKPYVYIRAGGWGCTSFTPTSLAKVQQGQNRTIKRVDYNTDKCRQEAPSDDVDGNGLPDDTQPLYTARQGDPEKGEDPSRIYLFRNFFSAEAQLGISDYTPTGTPAGDLSQPLQEWNLLTSSKPGEYIPAFNKLVILEDANGKPLPTILTKKQNGQCIAYQPDNTEIIKMTTQSSRYLTKLSNLPQGVMCD